MAKKKSETRVAFEKKFAAERRKRIKAGQPGDGGVFTFRGKKYTTDYAKAKPKKKESEHNFDYDPESEHMKKYHNWNPTANKTSKYAGTKKKKTKENTKKDGSYKSNITAPKKKAFNYSKKSKKKLGGFRDTFMEPPIEQI